MKHGMKMAGMVLAVMVGAAQAQTTELDGIGVSRDVPCNGQDVSISGNGNRFRLSGGCGQVLVHGSEHIIELGDASRVEITGVGNQVQAGRINQLDVSSTGHRVKATLRGEAERPAQVMVYGAENILTLGFEGPAQVDISGTGQQLDWRGDEPKISTSGIDHRIERH
ncbi:hypothetical protein BZL41_08955 [Pseudomonas sp. PIC25]|uniref:DUF3060 domain-containing protein n=1 Tax=Pseudomonas sp. PIC25 TaxID=1958773 RepID=UPI000BC459BB|nr:DUF3060 domain-containing protein [Pseudomonas sp. PIC25]PAU64761.1 hypothetical protein BZL41_08955 [Pseudomonas sp. PIC25]